MSVGNTADISAPTFLSYAGQLLVDNWVYPLGIISIVSNLLVLTSSGLILKSKLQPKSTYMFLGNLALADFLHGTIFLCVITIYPTIQGGLACVNIIGLTASYVIECSLSVCLIAIDRYIYIHHGLHYSIWMTTKRTRLILVGSWIFSLVVAAIPQMLFADYTTGDENCSFFQVTPPYLMVVISCAGIFFELTTVVLYILIFKTAYKTKRAIRAGSQRKKSKNVPQESNRNNLPKDSYSGDDRGVNKELNENVNGINRNISSGDVRPTSIFNETKNSAERETRSKQNKMKTKSTMIVFLSMCSCTVTWGPCFVCLMLYPMLCTNIAQNSTCSLLGNILLFIAINVGLINAVMNPIIYCWWHKGFRNYLKNLCFKEAARDRRRNAFLLDLRTS